MTDVRFSLPGRVRAQQALDRLRGTPRGFATLDEGGQVAQVAENLPKNEANGVIGLDADGKVPRELLLTNAPFALPLLGSDTKIDETRLPEDLARLTGAGTILPGVLSTNVPGGVLLLGEDGRVPDARLPTAVVRVGADGKVTANVLPIGAPFGIPVLDGGGKLADSYLPNGLVRLIAGKVPVEVLPPVQAAFNSFTSYVRSDGYYPIARLRPSSDGTSALLVDGHGRQRYRDNATSIVLNTLENMPYTTTGLTGHFTVLSTGPAFGSTATTSNGIEINLGGFDIFSMITFSLAKPMLIRMEVAPLNLVDVRYVFGLNSGDNAGFVRVLDYSGTGIQTTGQETEFSVFRLDSAASDTTWKVVHSNGDGLATTQVNTGVPFVPDQFIQLELRISSDAVVDYYINGQKVHQQTNFHYSRIPNGGRKALRALAAMKRITGAGQQFKIRTFEVMVAGDTAASLYY